MKSGLICRTIFFAVVMSAPQMARTQGTITYVSSLGSPSIGSATVGSDSWEAVDFFTGNNSGGYLLDSVELEMAPASGSPAGFEVMLYSAAEGNSVLPENRLATLGGSSDPTTGGMYTYAASDVTLSASTTYYIVLTAETAIASGFYAWSLGNSPANITGGWGGGGYLLTSSDGSSWNPTLGDPQFAVTATAVPEPDSLVLLGLTGFLFFIWCRWQA